MVSSFERLLIVCCVCVLVFVCLQSGGGGGDADDVKNEREYLLEIENENKSLTADLQVSRQELTHLHDEVEDIRESCDQLKHDKAMVLGQCDVLR